MKPEQLETLRDKFIKDPDWKLMEDLIFQVLDFKEKISEIQIDGRDSDVILAELVANSTLQQRFDALKATFESMNQEVKKPTSFR